MKQTVKPVALLAAFILVGCAAIETGHDPVVVNAERTTAVALETIDSFTKYERANRETLWSLNPGIKKYADYVRVNHQKWLTTATDLTRAYKYNRTPENKANLNTAIAVLQEVVNQINRYMTEAGAQR